MAKELTFSSATLGWRFAHTDIFLRHFIKQWELLQDVALKNLDEYWNINSASGNWLKQIGTIFDIERPQLLSDDAFMLDVDQLDDESKILDGTVEDMADDLFRKIILLHAANINKLFSIPNIAENLYQVFGRDQIEVEFIENIDRMGNAKDRYFQLLITFKDLDMLKLCVELQDTLPHALIGKPMGVSYDIYFSHNPNLGE